MTTTYVTISELLPAGRPLLVAALRVLPAGIVLVVIGSLTARWRPHGAEWGRLALLAAANFGVFFPLLAVAVYRLPGGVAASVGGLQPLFVAGLAVLLLGTRPRHIDLAVGVVAATGVGLVVLRPNADFDVVGLLAAVAANLSFATGVVLTKRFPAPPSRVAATGWQLMLSGALLGPLALLVEGMPPVPMGGNVTGFAYLSLGGTAVAFLLWFNGIGRLPVTAPPLLGLAAPVTGATVGWLVQGQALTPVQLLGFVVTVGAIAYGATIVPPDVQVRATTSFIGGSARASAASPQSTTAEVTTAGSKPASTAASTAGIAGRAWARPVWKVQQRVYIEKSGMAGSSR